MQLPKVSKSSSFLGKCCLPFCNFCISFCTRSRRGVSAGAPSAGKVSPPPRGGHRRVARGGAGAREALVQPRCCSQSVLSIVGAGKKIIKDPKSRLAIHNLLRNFSDSTCHENSLKNARFTASLKFEWKIEAMKQAPLDSAWNISFRLKFFSVWNYGVRTRAT